MTLVDLACMIFVVPGLRNRLRILTLGCVLSFGGVYIEKGMGLGKLQRETASTSRAPRFSIAKSHRDGENHAPRALDALEVCSKKLDSYLIL